MPAILGLPLNFRDNQRWLVFRLAEMEDPYKAVASQGVTTLIAVCPEKVCITILKCFWNFTPMNAYIEGIEKSFKYMLHS